MSQILLQRPGTLLSRIKRQLQVLIRISERNPQSFKFYESLSAIKKAQYQQMTLRPSIIHCFSMFSVYHEMVMVVVFFFCLIFLPLEVAFMMRATSSLHGFNLFLNVLCFGDMIVRFRMSYVDVQHGRVVMTPNKIARNYLIGCFFLDFLSSLPNAYFFTKEKSLLTHCITTLNLLKLFRVVTVYRYATRTAKFLNLNNLVVKIWIILSLYYLICHWNACVIFLLPQVRQYVTGHYYNDSWLYKHHLFNVTVSEQYIVSLYKASAYMLCIKQGSLDHLAWEEQIFANFCYLGGKGLTFYITVKFASDFLSKWTLETKFQQLIEEVNSFMDSHQIPAVLRNRLLYYYKYKFQNRYFEEKTIKMLITERLRQQINADFLRNFIANVEIFKNLPNSSLMKLISSLQLEIYLPGDLIIKYATVGEHMYFISSGTVGVFSPSGKEVCHLSDGAYFGEISLLIKNQKRTAHIFAIEICEVYKLSRKAFNNCLRPENKLIQRMMQEALDRMETTKFHEDIFVRSYNL